VKPSETRDIRNTIVMAETALGKKKALFTSKLEVDIMKKIVECY